MSRCLQLDVGNSGAKWRLVQAGTVIARGRYAAGEPASEAQLLGCVDTVESIWISSVARPAAQPSGLAA